MMKRGNSRSDSSVGRMDRRQFLVLRELVALVPVPQNVVRYAVRLCGATRPKSPGAAAEVRKYVEWGCGPRGSQFLIAGAKARALLLERTAPTVEDVRAVALPVLRHRVIPNYQAIGDGVDATEIVRRLLDQVQE